MHLTWTAVPPCIMVRYPLVLSARALSYILTAIAEGHGDAAMVLLKAGADTDKKDNNGALAIDLAPDAKV